MSPAGFSHLLRAAATQVATDTRVNQLTLPCAVGDTLVVVQIFPSSHPGIKKTDKLVQFGLDTNVCL